MMKIFKQCRTMFALCAKRFTMMEMIRRKGEVLGMRKRKMIMVAALTIFICLSLTGCKSSDYKKGVECQTSGDYEGALELYKGIEDYENYKDTADRVNECEAMIAAIEKYNAAKESLEKKNIDLDSLISDSEALIAEKKIPLDDTLIPALETKISETKAAKQSISEMPTTETEILEVVKTMEAVDYGEITDNLNNSKTALEKSIKQYALVDNPAEAYIIECLGKVEHVVDISAVTEDNDPNGNLNKPGGYTATVYYSDDRISLDKSVYGNTVIEQGTDGGGGIEVYATVEDAEKRRDYLSSFDGGILASGTHTVVGTVLVRTSNELTASQQQEMEAKIIEVLTYVE